MGLTEGWYVVRYGEGENERTLTAYCEQVYLGSTTAFLKVAYLNQYEKKQVRHIRIKEIVELESVESPAKDERLGASFRRLSQGIEDDAEAERVAAKEKLDARIAKLQRQATADEEGHQT